MALEEKQLEEIRRLVPKLAQEESGELLGREELTNKAKEKAQELVSNLDAERQKRRIFTYELERTKIETKAKTSLERANSFYREIKKLLK